MNDLMMLGSEPEELEAVYTDDMELPAGMTIAEALAIHRAVERRYVAKEVAESLNDAHGLKWAEVASEAVRAGEVSLAALFEATWAVYWDEGFGRFVYPCLREGLGDIA